VSTFEKWPIGKKFFFGNTLVLILPLLIIFAFLLYAGFTQPSKIVPQSLEAGPLAGLFSPPLALVLLFSIGALLATCAAYFLNRLLTTPLRQFAERYETPGKTKDLHYTGGCEATFLIDAFNQYAQQLRTTNEKLNVEVQFRKSAENFLQIYKKIFDNANEGIVITDATAKILAVNNAFSTITGYELAEVIGQNPRMLQSKRHNSFFYEQMWQSLTEKGAWEGEIWNKKKDGSLFPEWLTINAIRNERKEIVYFFATFYEIGELKKREKQITFMAYHDMLTRLPNRAHLENKLAKSLAAMPADDGKIAVFYIDLDNFKNVNDVFGHNQGDDLLIQVTQRFAAVLSENDTLCRPGGDEFILLMEHIENESIIYLMANRLLTVLKKPFLVDRKKIYINASIGISIYPDDGKSGLDLIRSADMAMHKAKGEGKNRYYLFTKGMHELVYEKFRIETGIRLGLRHKEFVVFYQPKVNIITRKTSSLEALIRWKKGDTLIPPDAFIPVAEESSLIDDLCLFVMEETCAFQSEMKKQRVAVPISVNISPRQFHNADFVDIVEDLLGRYQVAPEYMEFEITETTAMKDVEHTLKIMHRLRQMGILFSIDDFGTGYSSLGYLNKMPVSTLKIDKQFIDDLQENGGIVATIIAISQQMHLNVVAEGVETEEQLLSLAAMGCQEAQGYYFSRPLPGDRLLEYLLAEGTVL
jgi:diguanylate cyclase (GGDEF)-like protein/PAS domain S-box-containing protein